MIVCRSCVLSFLAMSSDPCCAACIASRLTACVLCALLCSRAQPDYLEYVRAHKQFKSVFHESKLEYTEDPDGIEVSIMQ